VSCHVCVLGVSSELSCLCVLGVSSELSSLCVLGVSSELSCLCVLGVSILTPFLRSLFRFWNCSDSVVLLFFLYTV
jgi:hypothetical protein